MIPELHEKAPNGTVKETRMDVVVSRPGNLERWMIDVRTVDGKSATANKKHNADTTAMHKL